MEATILWGLGLESVRTSKRVSYRGGLRVVKGDHMSYSVNSSKGGYVGFRV